MKLDESIFQAAQDHIKSMEDAQWKIQTKIKNVERDKEIKETSSRTYKEMSTRLFISLIKCADIETVQAIQQDIEQLENPYQQAEPNHIAFINAKITLEKWFEAVLSSEPPQ